MLYLHFFVQIDHCLSTICHSLFSVTVHPHIFPMAGSYPRRKTYRIRNSWSLIRFFLPKFFEFTLIYFKWRSDPDPFLSARRIWIITTASMAWKCERLDPGSSSLVPLSSQPQSILSQSARLIRKSASDGQVSYFIRSAGLCYFYALIGPSQSSPCPPRSLGNPRLMDRLDIPLGQQQVSCYFYAIYGSSQSSPCQPSSSGNPSLTDRSVGSVHTSR